MQLFCTLEYGKCKHGKGDFVYVQYGHNHKDDGPLGYLKAIPKYYEKAHSVGATTIYVGPIDRLTQTNLMQKQIHGNQHLTDLAKLHNIIQKCL